MSTPNTITINNGSVQVIAGGTQGPAGSGGITSVSNADSTLTVSPTTGAVLASINLAHANTWTGAQTFNGGMAGNASGLTSLTGANLSGNISGNAANVSGTVAIPNGGTGQTTANAALNALVPSQTSNSGKFLKTDGANTSWATATSSPGGSSGQLQYNNAGAFGGTAAGTYATSGTLFQFTAQAATDVPLVSKGATSQSAHLQQWQNSSGTVLANITATGLVQAPSGATSTPSLAFSSDTSTGLYRWGASVIGIALGGTNYHVIAPSGFQTVGQYLLTATIGAADVGLGRSAAGVAKITDTSSGLGSLLVGAYNASTVALTVKGASSQSADLQQWQNSSATTLSGVDANGYVRMVTGAGAPSSTPSDGAIYIDTTNNKLYARSGSAWKSVTLT